MDGRFSLFCLSDVLLLCPVCSFSPHLHRCHLCATAPLGVGGARVHSPCPSLPGPTLPQLTPALSLTCGTWAMSRRPPLLVLLFCLWLLGSSSGVPTLPHHLPRATSQPHTVPGEPLQLRRHGGDSGLSRDVPCPERPPLGVGADRHTSHQLSKANTSPLPNLLLCPSPAYLEAGSMSCESPRAPCSCVCHTHLLCFPTGCRCSSIHVWPPCSFLFQLMPEHPPQPPYLTHSSLPHSAQSYRH